MIDTLVGVLIAGIVNSFFIGFAVKHIDKKIRLAEQSAQKRADFVNKKNVLLELMQLKQNKALNLICKHITGGMSVEDSIKVAQAELNEEEKKIQNLNMDIVADMQMRR